jgi:xanthine dehydrogenase accessory factor
MVRIVLASVRGSAPREAGVCMLVGRSGADGTIGGGRLEWDALAEARALLDDASGSALIKRMVLGADLGQCCGGVVEVWLERYTRADLGLLEAAEDAARQGAAMLVSTLSAGGIERRIVRGPIRRATPDATGPRVSRGPGCGRQRDVQFAETLNDERPPLWLYGAGHVGQALARILIELPLRLTWIDSRAGVFPAHDPGAVRILCGVDPVASVADAAAATRFIVMTHSHALDFALCRAILVRDDFAWAGLIGSLSKAARFRSRLAREGLAAQLIGRLVCPIGVGGITSKWPAAIAVGVAAQILREIGAAAPEPLRDSQQAAGDPRCESGDCATCGSATAEPA